MSWALNILLVFAVLFVLPRVIGRVRVWMLVQEITFNQPRVEVVEDSQVPHELFPINRFARQQMESNLPFRFRGTILLAHEQPDTFDKYADIFVSYDGRTLATVMPNFAPAAEPFMVTYRTRIIGNSSPVSMSGTSSTDEEFADVGDAVSLPGETRTFETVNNVSHLMLAASRGVADSRCDSFQGQYQFHLDRIDSFPANACQDFSALDLAGLAAVELDELQSNHDRMVGEGIIREARADYYRMAPIKSWKISGDIIAGQHELGLARHNYVSDEDYQVRSVGSPEADAADYARLKQLNEAVATRRNLFTKWSILLISAFAFFIAFGYWLGFVVSAILLVVVFVHELGHISAMALFGYRNRQVLFIPFFGAAAIGEKDNAPAWQQLVVLFMGPLPGIVIGMVVLWISVFYLNESGMELQRETLLGKVASLTLVLNYLNLVPLGFLDGGKIVQILFFSRVPRARYYFQLLSALAFLLLAILAASWIIGAIAAISFLALPSQWRFGTMLKNLETSLDDTIAEKHLDEPNVGMTLNHASQVDDSEQSYQKRLEVFRLLRQPPQDRWMPRERFETARQLIEYIESKRVGLATIIIGSFAYLASIVVPILLFLLLTAMQRQAMV